MLTSFKKSESKRTWEGIVEKILALLETEGKKVRIQKMLTSHEEETQALSDSK